MDSGLKSLLTRWPLDVVRDVDIATVMPDSALRRYAAVNRALKNRSLIHLRRGLYLIGEPFRKSSPSNFQVAHSIYGPSYISFESALFHHQWIPEAVFITTSATAKRTSAFDTPLGIFQYTHVPDRLYYLGVERLQDDFGGIFIAAPWKAIADHYYVHHRNWNRPEDLSSDMRIEMEDMQESDLTTLQILSKCYQSSRVRNFLTKIYKGLTDGN